ncbi:hypothetical protein AAH678_16760 [Sodalis endosymbiont of Spalangia cameroni]|uniref:hypothetical protein n=1 Tax=Sodalis praecaptivus TaxID=1239307 RepID=UPI0031F99CD5
MNNDSDYMQLQKKYDALVVENLAMREAIEFATAPDMWEEQHDGALNYRYCEWYVDVLNAAIKQPDSDSEEILSKLEKENET